MGARAPKLYVDPHLPSGTFHKKVLWETRLTINHQALSATSFAIFHTALLLLSFKEKGRFIP